jgi:hypothetical protein
MSRGTFRSIAKPLLPVAAAGVLIGGLLAGITPVVASAQTNAATSEAAVARSGGGTGVFAGVSKPHAGEAAQPASAKGGSVGHLQPDGSALAKPAGGAAPTQARPGQAGGPLAPPSTVSQTIEGLNQATSCSCFPSDSNGSVSPTEVVETVNKMMRVYRKSDKVILRTVSLGSLFSNTTDSLFDPRVHWDQTWQRWIVVSTRRALSSTDTTRYFQVAVSTSATATGSFFLYHVNFSGSNGDWLDFPQLGVDQDAIIISGNFFHRNANNSDSNVASRTLSIAKARLYNGRGFSFSFFTVDFSTQPATVAGDPTQQNGTTWLASFNSGGGGQVHLFRMLNSSRSESTQVFSSSTIVIGGGVPTRQCNQPGTTIKLDCADARISGAVYQNGTSLWGVHNATIGSFPTARYFQLNTSSLSLVKAGSIFASGASDDFNASIAVNSSNEAFITWSSTNSGSSINAQLRSSGLGAADSGNVTPGSLVFTSPRFYSGGPILNSSGGFTGVDRWGDYSSVAIDPSAYSGCTAQRRAYLVNQKIQSDNTWGTGIGRFGFC